MPLYVYSCGAHDTELIRPVGKDMVTCHCGREAIRQSVYAVSCVTAEPSTRGRSALDEGIRYHGRDFIEASAEIAERADELSKREGMAVETPDFFGMAVRRANRLRAAGVTSSRDMR